MFTVGCHLDFFVCVFKDRNLIINQVQPFSKGTGLQGGLQILLTLPSLSSVSEAFTLWNSKSHRNWVLAKKTDRLDHLVSHYHVRLRTHQKHQNLDQNKKVKINEDIWRCREAARVHTGLDVTLRRPVIYTLWKLNLTNLLTVTGHNAWVGRNNESIVFCLFSCTVTFPP